MLPLKDAIIAVFGSGIAVFCTRAFPFALFSKRKPPAVLRFVEKYIPPMVMAILLVYCFRDAKFVFPPFGQAAGNGIPRLAALAVVAALHIWKGNAMASILCGTALYMALIKLP
jgi:branched-subunit amino acid transport protein AzlD